MIEDGRPRTGTDRPWLVRERPAWAGAASCQLGKTLPTGPNADSGPAGDVDADGAAAMSIDDLGDEIASLAARIHADTHRMCTLIACFDAREGWKATGHRGCAEWLAWRTGMDLHTAREHVRVARSLRKLPETSASMAEGKLSFSKVRALTRVAEPQNETELLEVAETCTAAKLERVVRSWKTGSREDEAASDALYREERGRGSEPPDAVSSSAAERHVSGGMSSTGPASGTSATDHVSAGTSRRAPGRDSRTEAARRRADAIGLLAERALAAGFGGGRSVETFDPEAEQNAEPASDARGSVTDQGTADSSRGVPVDIEGDSKVVGSMTAPLSGSRAERYQVLLHVDADTLSADREPGRSELEDGTRVSAETSRRLACDAAIVRVAHGKNGSVLSVGRRTRSIPPALRRALEVRDRGCRFPGCGSRFTDAHHVEHWADGGETSLDNCLLLCRFHHRLVHEGGWRIEWGGRGHAAFIDPRGRTRRAEVPEEEIRHRRRELRMPRGDQVVFSALE